MHKRAVAYILQVAGALALVVAAFLLHVVAGWAVAGLLALVFGAVLEREAVRSNPGGRLPVVPPVEGDA